MKVNKDKAHERRCQSIFPRFSCLRASKLQQFLKVSPRQTSDGGTLSVILGSARPATRRDSAPNTAYYTDYCSRHIVGNVTSAPHGVVRRCARPISTWPSLRPSLLHCLQTSAKLNRQKWDPKMIARRRKRVYVLLFLGIEVSSRMMMGRSLISMLLRGSWSGRWIGDYAP